jgi:hypothetical protein
MPQAGAIPAARPVLPSCDLPHAGPLSGVACRVGIMPVVNLHGFLCAWAPAAFDSREHPYFPPRPPPPSALRLQRMLHPRPSSRRGQRRGVRAEGAEGAVREFRGSFRLMRVGKARKVTGERLQQFVGSLVPEWEARERAEQMPHWHEGRTRRRGNLLDFDWRRAQWIVDVQVGTTAHPSASPRGASAGPGVSPDAPCAHRRRGFRASRMARRQGRLHQPFGIDAQNRE